MCITSISFAAMVDVEDRYDGPREGDGAFGALLLRLLRLRDDRDIRRWIVSTTHSPNLGAKGRKRVNRCACLFLKSIGAQSRAHIFVAIGELPYRAVQP